MWDRLMHSSTQTKWQGSSPLTLHRCNEAMWPQLNFGFWNGWNRYMLTIRGNGSWNRGQKVLPRLIMVETSCVKWCWLMTAIRNAMHKLPDMVFVFWQRPWRRICRMRSSVLHYWCAAHKITQVRVYGTTKHGIAIPKFLWRGSKEQDIIPTRTDPNGWIAW